MLYNIMAFQITLYHQMIVYKYSFIFPEGMAVFAAQNYNGWFEWRNASLGSWQKFSLPSQEPKKGGKIDVVLLKPNDNLRFFKNGQKSEWTEQDARENASLKFYFWDIDDNRTSGENRINLGNDNIPCQRYPVSFCCHTQYLLQIPIGGCDEKAGSILQNNACGNCTLDESESYKKCNDCFAVIGKSLILIDL